MKLDLDILLTACQAGEASHMVFTTEMTPAAGPFAAIAPARFATQGGSAYAYEKRWFDGEPLNCVLVDSKPSQLNRIEQAIVHGIADGHPALNKMPRIVVRYDSTAGEPDVEFSDLELPHRWTDAHVRSGDTSGSSVVQDEAFRAARNAGPADVSAVMELAPAGLVFGSWDSTRRSRQARYPSALVGEIIGVTADQESRDPAARHSGARVDPVAASVQLPGAVLKQLAGGQDGELSPTTMAKVKKLKDKEIQSASTLGLGNVPPKLEDVAGLATRRIIRSHVLSFATLRRLRFGGGPEKDAAARTLLAAVALWGLTASYSDGFLRANCHLAEASAPVVVLKGRFGHDEQIDPPTLAEADALLEAALAHAVGHGVRWQGQVMQVLGDPAVLAGADDTADPEGGE